MKKIIQSIKTLIKFITEDIWRIRLDDLKGSKAIIIKHQRIFILAIRNFRHDNCTMKSSGLTFYSMLSVVPFFAILFGIFKGFGLQKLMEKQLLENFHEYESVMIKIIDYSKILLENTKGGLIAGIGIIILLWTVIKLLNNIENSLNTIWKISYSRSIARQLTDYLAVIFLGPLFLILASGLTVFLSGKIVSLSDQFQIIGIMTPLISIVLKAIPYLIIWLLFTLVYKVMPNGSINLSSAFYAAVVAGTIYQIVQIIYVTFQIGIANYNAIYGSFAVFPLFLIWLQTSWMIFLFGAEISYAHQNINDFEFEADVRNISQYQKRLISLAVAKTVIKNFQDGYSPQSLNEIANKLALPINLTENIIKEFATAGLFSKVCINNEETFRYQPSKDIKFYTIKFITDTLDNRGSVIPLKKLNEFDSVERLTKMISNKIENLPENKLIGDI